MSQHRPTGLGSRFHQTTPKSALQDLGEALEVEGQRKSPMGQPSKRFATNLGASTVGRYLAEIVLRRTTQDVRQGNGRSQLFDGTGSSRSTLRPYPYKTTSKEDTRNG